MYDWKLSDNGEPIYQYTESELIRRFKYLKLIDQDVSQKLINNWSEDWSVDKYITHPHTRTILAFGAGSGKTSKIRNFIANNYHLGIVYAARTVNECNLLHYDICSQMVGNGISLDDVLKLIGNFNSTTELGEELKLNYSALEPYLVIITTHERLGIESPAILIDKSRAFSSDGVSNEDDTRRELLIIDEYPKLDRDCTIPNFRQFLSYFDSEGRLNSNISLPSYRKYIKSQILLKLNSNNKFERLATEDLILDHYSRMSLGITTKHFSDSVIHRMMFYLSLSLNQLYEKYNGWNIEGLNDKIRYTISDIKINNMLMFDGTGDLVSTNSTLWKVTSNYQKHVKLSKFDTIAFNLPRYYKWNSITEMDSELEKQINSFKSELVPIINKSKKTLIITWMNTDYKVDNENSITNINYARGIDIQSMIKRILTPSQREKTYFTHYQSGRTRATSDYSDADTIIIIGKFFLPNTAIKSNNEALRANSNYINMSIAELKQSIFRTQARVDKPINLYISDDWGSKFISLLLKNINCEKLYETPEMVKLNELIKRKSLTPNTRNEMYKVVRNSIINNNQIEITLDKLYTLIPMSRKEKDSYRKLITKFSELNYNFVIIK